MQYSRLIPRLAVAFCIFIIATAHAVAGYLNENSNEGFALVSGQTAAPILVEATASDGVKRAVRQLQQDVFRVTQIRPGLLDSLSTTQPLVLVAEMGKSQFVDELVAGGKIDVSALKDKWEGYLIQHVTQPFEHIKEAWVIVGADKRGAIYGVYDLSETIGVSPWYWWADVPVKKHNALFLKSGTRILEYPGVKYRGIFLNDEAPALTSWAAEKFGGFNAAFYEKVFELLLRLKANYLWPAMWNNAFADDDPQNALLANEMGIVMGTSHHEPMMRADKEWNRFGKGKWEYSTNPDNLNAFWQEGAKRYKSLEGIFTLGMRGQEDTPMSEGQNVALLEEVVASQRNILASTFDKPVSEIPQVWALYKEVQGFYERGMRVPDDVTLLWSDDNFGNIRRLPLPDERKRQGGAGVYYHLDYVGGPRSYRWINTVPLGKIYEQMSLAWEYGARDIWIVNVGDLKPMELPVDFFLSMAWAPERFDGQSASRFTKAWAAQQFTPALAPRIAKLLSTYSLHNGRRKPEALSPDTYSIYHYDEADRVSDELEEAAKDAHAIESALPDDYQSAFYQLVGYPVWATRTIFELNYAQALNRRDSLQNRASTSASARQVTALFEHDAALTKRYHALKNGRWNHMMSQPHIGYVHWRNPPANLPPVTHEKALAQPAVADMGVAIPSQEIYWPANEWSNQRLALKTFTPYGNKTRSVTVYNRQGKPFDFVAKASEDWVRLSHTSGKVTDEVSLEVSIDWSALSPGHHEAAVWITGTGWGSANVQVTADKPTGTPHGFVEADGVISLLASRGVISNNSETIKWELLDLHGRTGQAVRSFVTATGRVPDELSSLPVLSFPLYFFSTGEFDVKIDVSPSQAFFPNQNLRFAMAMDDQKAVTLEGRGSSATWAQEVLDNVRTIHTKLKVTRAGPHTLNFIAEEPGVVMQKIVIDTGGLMPSYLGPPPSPYIEIKPSP